MVGGTCASVASASSSCPSAISARTRPPQASGFSGSSWIRALKLSAASSACPSSIAALASARRSADGMLPPASFSSASTKRLISPSGSAPWNRSAICPCQKAATVGTDCSGRPSWLSCATSERFLSMSIFTRRTRPPAARVTRSSAGVSCLHGPHHVAQKSTRTGTVRDASITSAMKLCWSPSRITTSRSAGSRWAGSALGVCPMIRSIMCSSRPPSRRRHCR